MEAKKMRLELVTMLRIEGQPIAKKNSRRIVKKKFPARLVGTRFFPAKMGRISIPSEAYGRFRDDAAAQIAAQYSGGPVSGCLLMELLVEQKGGMLLDFDNALSSFCDVLQDAKVIVNDKDICWVFGGKMPGAKEWVSHISIYKEVATCGDTPEACFPWRFGR